MIGTSGFINHCFFTTKRDFSVARHNNTTNAFPEEPILTEKTPNQTEELGETRSGFFSKTVLRGLACGMCMCMRMCMYLCVCVCVCARSHVFTESAHLNVGIL